MPRSQAPEDRYAAHVRRISVLRDHAADGVAREYWTGYRIGMTIATGAVPPGEEHDARLDLAEHAAVGDVRDINRLARGAGIYDGMRWDSPRDHRGLLHLVMRLHAGGSSRGLARRVVEIDERSMRRITAGESGIGSDLHAHLLDLLHSPA